MKMRWIILATLVPLAVGLAAFPISMHLEKTTGRYDSYSVIGFGVSLIFLFNALLIFTVATVCRVIVWWNREPTPQALPDLERELPEWDVEK